MINQLTLCAQISQLESLRYTPAGLPVLEMLLKHQSYQQEAGQDRAVNCEVQAKLFGDAAKDWQYAQDSVVNVTGFLTHKSLRNPRLVLHIQTIELHKG
ncbi:primosomal replication protein N [Neisseriaceae bacterium CLB008]|nr:primosomal replication protein N [Neisseriaceae bacterium]